MTAFLAFFVLTDSPIPTAVDASVSGEILVIGERVKRGRWFIKDTKKGLVCTTKITSGDKDVDTLSCNSMLHCASSLETERSSLQTILADKLVKKDAKRLANDLYWKNYSRCFRTTRGDLIAELAERRAGLK
jgi:hypothetical protein